MVKIKTLIFFFISFASFKGSQLAAGNMTMDCPFSGLVVDVHPCHDSLYAATIDFDYATSEANGFNLWMNGMYFGYYVYSDLPLTIDSLQGTDASVMEFEVCENDVPDCCISATVLSPCICLLDEPVYAISNCSDDSGIFDIMISFTPYTGSDSFQITGIGAYFGMFAYADLPVTLTNLPMGNTYYQFQITDEDYSSCQIIVEPGVIEACPSCEIFDLVAELHPCDDNGLMLADLAFSYDHPESLFFVVTGNGVIYDTFYYGHTFYTIGPVIPDCETEYEFIVADLNNPQCHDEFVFNDPPCCTGHCQIDSVILTNGECASDTSIHVTLDLSYTHTSGQFNIAVNDMNFSTVNAGDLPIRLHDVPYNSGSYFLVCDANKDQCCADLLFNELDCLEDDGCTITGVFAEAHPCDSSGNVLIDIEFDFDNVPSDRFLIVVDSVILDTFVYGQEYYTFGPLPATCDSGLLITIEDINASECVGTFIMENGPCCEEECSISELEYFHEECTSDTTFHITIDFDHNGTGTGFNLIYRDSVYGPIDYTDLPVRLFNLPYTQGPQMIIACDSEEPGCCKTQWIEDLDCDDNMDCGYNDLLWEISECDTNDMFDIHFTFSDDQTGDNGFTVSINGAIEDTFSYGAAYYIIEDIPADCHTIYTIELNDIDIEGCAGAFTLDHPVCCDTDCFVEDLHAFGVECANDTSLHLSIDLNGFNPNDNGYDVFVNGTFFTYLSTSTFPVRLHSLPYNSDIGTIELIVCANDLPMCCDTTYIDDISCGSCSISGVIAEPHECDEDGRFLVDIAFQSENTGLAGFTIRGNGHVYGSFEYGLAHYTIGPLDGDCETLYEFVIIDNQIESCSGFTYFEDPVCCPDSCFIGPVNILSTECVEDDLWKIVFEFEYEHTMDTGFDVFVDSEFIDFLPYEFPAVIYFPKTGDEQVIHLKVCHNDNPECCSQIEVFLEDPEIDCHINDLSASPTDCNQDGDFYVVIDFDFSSGVAQMFKVSGNGAFYGTFAYTSLPLALGPLQGDGAIPFEFVITDSENPQCSASIVLGHIDCSTSAVLAGRPGMNIRIHVSDGILSFHTAGNQQPEAVAIYTMNGQRLMHLEDPLPRNVNIGGWPNGVYFVRFAIGDKIWLSKFVILD